MSLKQHPTAHVQGWNGPIYPPGVADIAHALSHRRSTFDLVAIAQRVRGYRSYVRPSAADGYKWFTALQFGVLGGVVVIAIPWAQDFDEQDGVRCDRSPAVYTRGIRVSSRAVAGVLAEFLKALRAESGIKP